MVSFEEYQASVARTAGRTGSQDENLAFWALGVAGESSEVGETIHPSLGASPRAGHIADHVKKAAFHGHELDRDHLIEEVGDELWYLAALMDEIGSSLGEAAQRNVDKLRKRYPDGFSQEASKARVDVENDLLPAEEN